MHHIKRENLRATEVFKRILESDEASREGAPDNARRRVPGDDRIKISTNPSNP
jgi:hypothetical protein